MPSFGRVHRIKIVLQFKAFGFSRAVHSDSGVGMSAASRYIDTTSGNCKKAHTTYSYETWRRPLFISGLKN